MKVKCLIIEDEPLASDLLSLHISKIPELELAMVCNNAVTAGTYLTDNPVDILFVDIELPELNGLDFIRSLTYQPAVIITSAFSEYALEGYELEVTDYLLKPIKFERFYTAVMKALKKSKDLEQANSNASSEEYFFIKSGTKMHKINIKDIQFIEAMSEYVQIHTSTNKFMTLNSMSKILESLPGKNFVRVHRSYIVNIEKIDAVNGNTVEMMDKKIPISKSNKEDFTNILNQKRIN